MEKMIGIAFTSSMKYGLSKAERKSLVKDARVNNKRLEISSVLLHCDGSFMQYMEGPEADVDAAYSRIELDSRHRGVIQLFHRGVSEREFVRSEMRYCETGEADSETSEVSAWLRPKGGSADLGRTVLSGFWKNNNLLQTKF